MQHTGRPAEGRLGKRAGKGEIEEGQKEGTTYRASSSQRFINHFCDQRINISVKFLFIFQLE